MPVAVPCQVRASQSTQYVRSCAWRASHQPRVGDVDDSGEHVRHITSVARRVRHAGGLENENACLKGLNRD
jgi:hypothetical protein